MLGVKSPTHASVFATSALRACAVDRQVITGIADLNLSASVIGPRRKNHGHKKAREYAGLDWLGD
jgi:hypothetical protein